MDVLAYDPDLVIVMENINDLTIPYRAALTGDAVDQNYLVRYGSKEMTGAIDQDDVVPIRVLRAVGNRLRPDPPREPLVGPVDVEPGAALFERNLKSITGIAAVHGVPLLLLLTMPLADSIWRKCVSGRVHRRIGGTGNSGFGWAVDLAMRRGGWWVVGRGYWPAGRQGCVFTNPKRQRGPASHPR